MIVPMLFRHTFGLGSRPAESVQPTAERASGPVDLAPVLSRGVSSLRKDQDTHVRWCPGKSSLSPSDGRVLELSTQGVCRVPTLEKLARSESLAAKATSRLLKGEWHQRNPSFRKTSQLSKVNARQARWIPEFHFSDPCQDKRSDGMLANAAKRGEPPYTGSSPQG